MAWTAPRTWVTNEVVTAALMNAHVRDNLLETSAATVTTAGDMTFADAANSMGSRLAIGAAGDYMVSSGSAPGWQTPDDERGDSTYTSTTGANTGYFDLSNSVWNSGTSVSFGVDVIGQRALVFYGAQYLEGAANNDGIMLSYRVSGATVVAADDAWAMRVEATGANYESYGGGRVNLETALTNGTNTFTLQAKTLQSAVGNVISRPYLIVLPF